MLSAVETIEQTFNGNPDFGKKVTCTLSRNGDLIHKIWIWVKVPSVDVPSGSSFRWLNWLGHLMINYVEFEIGGQRIDKHYGDWMQVFAELTTKPGHQAGYASLVGNVPALTNITSGASVPALDLYIPLQFYFNRNPGLAVPLVALQYHEVKINLELKPLSHCCWHDPTFSPNVNLDVSLLCDYVFLDSDERRRFAQVSHEYLITQLQFTGDESTNTEFNKFKLAFNHPTKEIIWASVSDSFTDGSIATGNQPFNWTTRLDSTYLTGTALDPLGGGVGFTGNDWLRDTTLSNLMSEGNYPSYDLTSLAAVGDNPTALAKLVLNGHDRFDTRNGRWFNLAVPYCCHENIPSTGINVYSFALRPEEHQPSGSINMSRIDAASLHVTLDSSYARQGCKVKIWAVNYNILRIMSGMGGLAYSN